ncbi:MAG: N-acetylmuramic acid 6-phosphate etherase [Bacteroidota bacterium]
MMKNDIELFRDLSQLLTEQRNPNTEEIDSLPTTTVLKLINAEDKNVAHAVEHEIYFIAQAVDLVVAALRSGGRLIYVGAGSSGRLGVIDASECPPTFGTDPRQITGVIAGGNAAMFRSQEGAEDNTQQAMIDIDALAVGSGDVVCGIAASRRTPYVVKAVAHAKSLGAKTIYVTTNPRAEFDLDVDVAICPEVGPEVLMGSTRLKSGTAQKLVLNMISTVSMIRLGKVYANMMVDLQLTNKKLEERAKRIIMMATDVSYDTAATRLVDAGGNVKTAIVMIKRGIDAATARAVLRDADGFVRRAIKE